MTRIAILLAALSLVAGFASGSPRSAPAPASIGVATMAQDGTITLDLVARGPHGESGHGRLSYPPAHPQYREVLTHLGGLSPGETKPVPPWPRR